MKKIITIFTFLLINCFSNPSGEKVIYGDIDMRKSEGVLYITQSSEKAIIEWDSFSIKSGELTYFDQHQSYSVLNRVVGASASLIEGKLIAKGDCFLINPNGIIIGPGGIINAYSFIGSTLDVNDNDFLNGGDITFSGSSLSKIENNGNIENISKNIFLIAREVTNTGVLQAQNKIGIAAGTEVFLYGSEGDVLIQVSGDGAIDHSGQISSCVAELKAAGGQLGALAINCSGSIVSSTATTKRGSIILKAESGTVDVSGNLSTNLNTTGGLIHILGDYINIRNGAYIESAGSSSGGTVLIGGDYQGKNPLIKNAQNVLFEKDAKISSSATEIGDGGKVILWGDNITEFYGDIHADGGIYKGDGGFVEVSGLSNLVFKGTVSCIAYDGEVGELLLDPSTIYIDDWGSAVPPYSTPIFAPLPPPTETVYDPTTASGEIPICQLDIRDLQNALALANVKVQTTNGSLGEGYIRVNHNITWNAPTKLTLIADRNIFIPSGIIISNTYASTGRFDAMDFQAFGNRVPGDTGQFHGIQLSGRLETVGGNIRLEGKGCGPTAQMGVYFTNTNSNITSTGVNENGGNITIIGHGSDGEAGDTGANHGIYAIFNGTISSRGGKVTLEGHGGGISTSSGNYGISLIGFQINCINDASIELNGYGGEALSSNYGVNTDDSGAIQSFLQTENGNITINGYGVDGTSASSDDNMGIHMFNTTLDVTGTGAIFINGEGSTSSIGTDSWGMYIYTSTIGGNGSDISIEGYGTGIFRGYGLFIRNTSISNVGSGDILMTGYGDYVDTATEQNVGIHLTNVDFQVVDGDINLLGQSNSESSATLYNYGIDTTITGVEKNYLKATGLGNIILDGTGGNGTDLNHGVSMITAEITTNDGYIQITGQGGDGGSNSDGIIFTDSSFCLTTNGNITLTGTGGGDTATGGNVGVAFASSSYLKSTHSGVSRNLIEVTGNGKGTLLNNDGILFASSAYIEGTNDTDIKLTGTGGDVTGSHGTSSNRGIHFLTGAYISANTGGIDLNGYGKGNHSQNYGIFFENVSYIESTGTNTDATIDLYAEGGLDVTAVASYQANYGLYMYQGAYISTVNHNIIIETKSLSRNQESWGGRIRDGSFIESIGTGANAGTIGITATGSANAIDSAYGLYIAGSYLTLPAHVTSVDGDINITATGGGVSASSVNNGLRMSSSYISSTGSTGDAANISITGHGGGGTDSSNGISLDTIAYMTSDAGNITMNGDSSGTGEYNHGISVIGASYISTTSGDISLTGSGADGTTRNRGIYFHALSYISSANAGARNTIELTGNGGSGAEYGVGIFFQNSYISGGAETDVDDRNTDIILTGTGSPNAIGDRFNIGIWFNGVIDSHPAYIEARDGKIELIGLSYGVNAGNHGIFFRNNAYIRTWKDYADKIYLHGTGGRGSTTNNGSLDTDGIFFFTDCKILSAGHDIELYGYSETYNEEGYGIWFKDNVEIATESSGNINFYGYGGEFSEGFSIGLFFSGYPRPSSFSTVDGDIYLEGIGKGIDTENSRNNTGFVCSPISISSSGIGSIEIVGTSGYGIAEDEGVQFKDESIFLSTNSGDITITGTSRSSGDSCPGIYFRESLADISTTDGNIYLTGVGGVGSLDNVGILFYSEVITSTNGEVVIDGMARGYGSGNYGIKFQLGIDELSILELKSGLDLKIRGKGSGGAEGIYMSYCDLQTTGAVSGDIYFEASSFFADATANIDSRSGLGDLYIYPYTSGGEILLGTSTSSSTATSIDALQEIETKSFSTMYIGELNAGSNITFGNGSGTTLDFDKNIEMHGNDIDLNLPLNLNDKNLVCYIGELAASTFDVDKAVTTTGDFEVYSHAFDDKVIISVGDQKVYCNGGGGTNTLQGPPSGTWTLTADNAGTVRNVTFENFQVLIGGFGNDIFDLGGAFSVASINGGIGTNTIIGGDRFNWQITGNNIGSLDSIPFTNIQNLTGGGNDDYFTFSDGASVSGTVDGGGGYNTIDLTQYTSTIYVSLSAGIVTGTGFVTNIQRVLPENAESVDDYVSAVFTESTLGSTQQAVNNISTNFTDIYFFDDIDEEYQALYMDAYSLYFLPKIVKKSDIYGENADSINK